MQRDFKGVWIPKEIWENSELGWLDKLMLTEIDSLDNENGCFASNDYFSKFFNVSKRRVIDVINNLENNGFIVKQMIYKKDSKQIEKRIIRVVQKSSPTQCRKVHPPSAEKFTRGSEENCTDNNTSFNNTFNNTFNKKDIVEQSSTTSQIIEYLNLKAGTNYKPSSKTTKQHINARLKEGFKLEDFKKVIDTKCDEWINDSKMKQYLRPNTLFGTKFESYLNQQQIRGNKNAEPFRVDDKGNKRDEFGLLIL